MGGAVAGAAPHLRDTAGRALRIRTEEGSGRIRRSPGAEMINREVDRRTRRRIRWTVAILALIAAGIYVGTFLEHVG